MIGPARVAAYDVVRQVSEGRADLPTALARIRDSLSDDRDRGLATEIATGVERWRLSLDYLIAHMARRALDRLDPEVVDVLRVASYQLVHLTRVPASAVVDDAVDMVRRIRKRSASGFVNAVLRNLSRSRRALPLPARPPDPQDREAALVYLTITLSHPLRISARWYDRMGLERAECWMQFNNQPAPLTLRANTNRISPDDICRQLAAMGGLVSRGRYAPGALVVESGQLPHAASAMAGLFIVQDEASQLVTLLAGDAPGPLILDTCAAPGGKATALAAVAGVEGRVIACDVRDRRMELLKRAVEATGITNMFLVQADLLAAVPFTRLFNTVILDAPCSGLGTLRRDPDIKWRRHENDLASLARGQDAMLAHAADAVASGGRLVYATCSSEPEENEQVVDRFLSRDPRFKEVDARRVHPALPADVVDVRGHLRTSPDRHGLEAFFGAVFERARDL